MKRLTWEEKYELLKEYLKEHNGKYPNSREFYREIALGRWVNMQRAIYSNGTPDENGLIRYNTTILTKEQVDKLNSINFKWKVDISEIGQDTWDKRYELLKKYLNEHNGEYPKARDVYEDVHIGSWIDTQRKVYNNGVEKEDGSRIYDNNILTIDQIKKLNEINFLWKSNTYETEWLKKIKLLEKYLSEHNGEYPKSNEIYKEIKLGQWVVKLREIYSNGELQEDGSIVYNAHQLAKWQIDKLNSINFKWKNNTYDSKWFKNYKLLKEYLKEHDGEYPKSNEIYKEIKLGQWVSIQRLTYNNGVKQEDDSIRYRTTILTKEQVEKLNNINFLWRSNKYEANWETNYNLFKEYLEEYNGRYPKQNEIYKEVNLGNWVSRQRTIYNNGELLAGGITRYYNRGILTKEQVEKLNNINFLWESNTYEANWETNYNLLIEYLEEYNGKYPKEIEIYKGQGIGLWVNMQRTIYNNGVKQEDDSLRYRTTILTKEQVEKLNNINFLWESNTYETNWEINYNLFKEYLEEYNGRYPTQKEIYKEIKLGQWVAKQRTIYSNGELQEDGTIVYNAHQLAKWQIEKLNKIGFIWISYTERDYLSKIKSNKREEILKKKLLYKLKKVLEDSKNEIKEKEDIEKIEKEFVKTLTMFD